MIESDSLDGTKCVNALNGTGVDSAELLLALLDPPPLLEEPLVDVLERDVPLSDVVALDDVPVLVLMLESVVGVVPAVEAVDSAEVEFALVVPGVELVLPEDSAEVVDAADETPLVVDAVSRELLAPVAAAPAPDEEPAVFDAVAATVPVVVACT